MFNFEEVEISLDAVRFDPTEVAIELDYTLAHDSTPVAFRFYASSDAQIGSDDTLIGEPQFILEQSQLTEGQHTVALNGEFLESVMNDDTTPFVLVEMVPTNGQFDPTSSNNLLPIKEPDTPVLSISDARVVEGDKTDDNRLVFTIARSSNVTAASVRVTTSDGTAQQGKDYDGLNEVITFEPGGDLSRTISIRIRGENKKENDETLTITLSEAVDASIDVATATGTIIDDDKRSAGAYLAGDLLLVLGSRKADVISVSPNGSSIVVRQNGDETSFAGEAVAMLYIDGQNKNDTIAVEVDRPALIHGRGGHDTITGGSQNDTIFGDKGHDSLAGTSGSDEISGGSGKDTLTGGVGDDTLRGGSSNDSMHGGSGHDFLSAGSGRDTLIGSAGHDTLIGSTGHDSLSGNSGNDSMSGGDGNDTLSGASGDDELFGSAGKDSLSGGSGDDYIQGGSQNDTINGNSGNDLLLGSGGNDLLDGGSDDDVILAGDQNDLASGGSGRDILFGGDGTDELNGGAEDDIVVPTSRTALPIAGLLTIRAEWTSARDYSTRVANITDGSGSTERLNEGYFLQPGSTVTNDTARDELTGGDSLDWFFVDAARDLLLDLEELEIQTSL